MKTTFPLILAWIWIWTAAVEGMCGWTKVVKGEEVNFNWDSHILEIKTEKLCIGSSKDKQLEIEFIETVIKSVGNTLKMKSFILTQDENGHDAILNFDIMLSGQKRRSWIPIKKPLGELRWTMKKNEFLNLIQVTLAATALQEHFDIIPMQDMGFQFGSGDTMSISYRVTPIRDDDCVKSGIVIQIL